MNIEQVAYWYFRLNGCFTITNFVLHHAGRGQRTEADILAVRFPHRCELYHDDLEMPDAPCFVDKPRIDLIIAEVTTKCCKLNGPWTDPNRENMHRVLYAIGIFPKCQVPEVAKAIYQEHQWDDSQIRVRLFALGRSKNEELANTVTQIDFSEMLSFMHERFCKFKDQKNDHPQWDFVGRHLFACAIHFADDKDAFISCVLKKCSVL